MGLFCPVQLDTNPFWRKSFQQCSETRLLKVLIFRQCFTKSFIFHDDERDAVGKRPVLITPQAHAFKAAIEKLGTFAWCM